MKQPKPALSDPNWSVQVSCGTHTTKKNFNLGESWKKSCSFLPSNLRQNSKCDRHVIWSEMGHIKTRRKKNRLTLMYKISHNLVDINTEEHLIPNRELRTCNSHAFKYRMPKVSKDVFKFSFFPTSITEWNSLPADLVNCKSLSDFKLNLGKHVKYVKLWF